METKKENKALKILLIIAIFIASICLCIDIVTRLISGNKTQVTKVTSTGKNVTITDDGIAESVNKIYDATVIVEVGSQKELTGWGSGFVYKTDNQYGYVFTNHHVVDKASRIVIVNTKGEEVEAELIGSDEYQDVAIVKMPIKNVVAVAELGKSSDLALGDTVFAVGTPVSLQYKFSVTRGIISGKDRMVQMNSTTQNGYSQQIVDSWYMNLLQIDASINSGNSGGPLANANGEVVGITNSKLASSASSNIENMGFAIPIEDAVNVANMIEKNGEVTRPLIGVALADIAVAKYNGFEVDPSITSGALLTNVTSGGAADKAGLKTGDVIIKVGDYKIENYKYFKYYLYRYNIGDSVEITYKRGSKELKTIITLTK